jgi:hypothetical protein
MKGNTIVRKMKDLRRKSDALLDKAEVVAWEQEDPSDNRKLLIRIRHHISKFGKKSDNIWYHNVPRRARIECGF